MGIVLLSPTKREGVLNLPLISFNFFSSHIDFSKYDYLIFTSKTAVEAADRTNPQWKEIPSFAVGSKTEKEILKQGGKIEFTGNGYGESLTTEILKSKNKKNLFIRGKEVANDLKEILKDAMEIEEAILYETTCKPSDTQLEDDSIIIFTSPSTVHCFFKNYTWNDSFKAIAIGETTKKAFPKTIKVLTPKETSIDSCIELANNLGARVV